MKIQIPAPATAPIAFQTTSPNVVYRPGTKIWISSIAVDGAAPASPAPTTLPHRRKTIAPTDTIIATLRSASAKPRIPQTMQRETMAVVDHLRIESQV
jgi:hypothetical protein